MISRLDNSNDLVARQIYTVFQRSYRVETEFIGVENFPPLKHPVEDFVRSKSDFYGFFEGEYLAGGIEVVLEENRLEINSLVVEPDHFRKGIAGKLIKFVLGNYQHSLSVMETAVVNAPANSLYQKHGFVEFKCWVPSHGVETLTHSRPYENG